MSDETIESEQMTTDELKEMIKNKLCRSTGSEKVSVDSTMRLVKKAIDMSVDATERIFSERTSETVGEGSPLIGMVSCNTDIMERLGLVEGSLKDSEEYQSLHVDTIKQLIETCRDLYADYKMHHDPRIRKVLMKEGLMFPETEEELEIFENPNRKRQL